MKECYPGKDQSTSKNDIKINTLEGFSNISNIKQADPRSEL